MAKKKIDVIGKRFGRLRVIKEVEPKGYKRRYLCKCDCGNEKVVYLDNLSRGMTTSCGCFQKEKARESSLIDLTGKRFGFLTVINQAPSKNNRTYWRCECNCGKSIVVEASRLLNGKTKSCGCFRKEEGFKRKNEQEEKYRKDGVMVTSLKRKINKNNSTGVKGVSLFKTKKSIKYRAQIGIKNTIIDLGVFDTIEEATLARKQAEEKYHKSYLED